MRAVAGICRDQKNGLMKGLEGVSKRGEAGARARPCSAVSSPAVPGLLAQYLSSIHLRGSIPSTMPLGCLPDNPPSPISPVL